MHLGPLLRLYKVRFLTTAIVNAATYETISLHDRPESNRNRISKDRTSDDTRVTRIVEHLIVTNDRTSLRIFNTRSNDS